MTWRLPPTTPITTRWLPGSTPPASSTPGLHVNGNPITTASGEITGVNLDNIGTAAATSDVKVISSGAGFVVAWNDAAGTSGARSSPAVAPARHRVGCCLAQYRCSAWRLVFTGEFAIGALLDTNGFALTVAGRPVG